MLFLCVNMTSKRGDKKQPTATSEEDFEAFVIESLARLCEGQEKIIQDITNLKAKVQLNEGALAKISKQFTKLNESLKELKGYLYDARCKVDEIDVSVQSHTMQINQMYECHLERYSREYNLCFVTLKNPPARTAYRKSRIFYQPSLI